MEERSLRRIQGSCVERNSFDKVVSDWLYHRDIRKTLPTHINMLSAFLYQDYRAPTDWLRYTDNNTPVCSILRYENVEEEFSVKCAALGLPPIALPRLKENPNKKHYSNYYDKATYQTVQRIFKNEIKYFGYLFEHQPEL